MNPGSQQMNINIHRNDLSQPWGFRLQGGADFSTPLSVQLVNTGSLAEQFNLRPGDAVLTINGKPSVDLDHEAAKYEILMAKLDLNLLIQRGAVNVWKPKVTPMADIKPQELQTIPGIGNDPFVQRTSLAADKMEPMRIGSNYNRSARPFPGFGGASSAPAPAAPQQGYAPLPQQQAPPPPQAPPPEQHAGYGAQQGGYGGMEQQQQQHQQQNIAADHSARFGFGGHPVCPPGPVPGGPGYGAPPPPPAGPAPSQPGEAPLASGMRSVRAPVTKPPGERAPQQQIPVCATCGGLIVGVFVKISGEPLHPECFKCMHCGKNLKNQGHFTVEGKRYCDVCAPQVAAPPGSDMSAIPIYR